MPDHGSLDPTSTFLGCYPASVILAGLLAGIAFDVCGPPNDKACAAGGFGLAAFGFFFSRLFLYSRFAIASVLERVLISYSVGSL